MMPYCSLTFLEYLVSKFILLVLTLLTAGVVRAQEAGQETVMPEPNYLGIIIFLVLMVGVGGWFMWKVMRNTGDGSGDKK
jgi:hypothetical protein